MMMSQDQKTLPPVIDTPDLLSGVEQMIFEDFREHLKEKGLYTERDLLAALLHEVLKVKGRVSPVDLQKEKKNKEMLFAYEYGLNEYEMQVLKLMARGQTYSEISSNLQGTSIGIDAVNKRIQKIYRKLKIKAKDKKRVASAMLIKAGIL